MKREITINGKQYPVEFNMTTVLTYEEIVDQSFFGEKFVKFKNQAALVLSAVFAADEKTDIELEELLQAESLNDVQVAFVEVMEMAAQFFKVPKVAEKEEAEEAAKAGEGAAKN